MDGTIIHFFLGLATLTAIFAGGHDPSRPATRCNLSDDEASYHLAARRPLRVPVCEATCARELGDRQFSMLRLRELGNKEPPPPPNTGLWYIPFHARAYAGSSWWCPACPSYQ